MKFYKDAAAWLLAVGAFLLFALGLEINIFLSLGLAAVVFAGLFFIFNPRTAAQESRYDQQRTVNQVLAETRSRITKLYMQTDLIEKRPVQDQLRGICKLATEIVTGLDENEATPLSTATKLDFIFQQVQQVVDGYVNLMTFRTRTDPAKLSALTTRVENTTLPQIEAALRDFARDLGKGEITQLEVTMQLLESTLKFEGIK